MPIPGKPKYPYFTGPCDLRYDATASRILGKDHWRVLQSFDLVLSDIRRAHVEEGTLTDKGSIPMLLNGVVPRDGKFEQAYVTHDQLCEYLSLTVGGLPTPVSRATADGILETAMYCLGGTDYEVQVVVKAVDAYRIASGVNKPTSTPQKRELEADWDD